MKKKANSKIDAKIFKRTASSTKAVNLNSRIFRGGTRL